MSGMRWLGLAAFTGAALVSGACGEDAAVFPVAPDNGSPSSSASSSTSSGTGGTTSSSSDSGGSPSTTAGFVSGGRLKARYYEAEDGSRQLFGWRDTVRGENCFFTASSDGSLRCIPTGGLYPSVYFSDASCANKLAGLYGCEENPEVIRGYETVGCSQRSPLFARGPKHTGSSVWSGTNCTEQPTPGDVVLYEVGAEISPSEFVTAEEKVE